MSKIEPLHDWSADAALKSAMDDIGPNDKVLIICQKENGDKFFRSANFTNCEILFEFERIKLRHIFNIKEV